MSPAPHSRPVIFERRSPRWTHLVCVIAAAVLTTILIMVGWFGLGDQDPLITSPDSGWDIKLALSLATLVGTGLTLGFLYRLVRNPPCFRLYEDGFEYIPAGVSTGLIRFADVVELRDEAVLTSHVSTTGRQGVTAVVLRNPDEYVRRFPLAVQPLLKARGQMNSSAILITHGEFGAEHDRILAMLRERVAQAAAAPKA